MTGLLGASLLARLPLGIEGLALVLFLREETGSFAVAGAAAGVLALGEAVGSPLTARLVDRAGPRVMLALGAVHGAGLIAMLVLGSAGTPSALVLAAAFVTGMTFPPTSAVLRAMYPRLAPDHVQGAYALDSVLTESIFVVGPLLTGLLVALVAPGAALVLGAAAVVVGTAAFVAALPAPGEPPEPCARDARDWLGALRAPGVRTLVGAMLPVGFAFGALEVALPAFADSHGRPELAGALIAIWAGASAVGGLVYGARTRRSPLTRVHLRLALLLPLGFLAMAAAGSVLAMALLVIPAGVVLAPLIATRNELTGNVAPEGFETEAFTWPVTALVAGFALGAAVAGGLVETSGWQLAVFAAAGAAALGAAFTVSRRATLDPVGAAA
jgi:MFS family permease